MRHGQQICVVIPARNEAAALPNVLADMPDWVDTVLVADNGSSDGTADVASQAGATVISVPQPGYGRACLRAAESAPDNALLVFMDGDYSDHGAQMGRLVDPIIDGRADLVIGSRMLGRRESGALTFQQRAGNALACTLIRLRWRHRYTDLGPFRAIRRADLLALQPRELSFGWTVEMQIRALRLGLRCTEVPVDYRRRIGVSKISGTVSGTIKAGYHILGCIGREALRKPPAGSG